LKSEISLVNKIKAIAKNKQEINFDDLSQRKKKELLFHDKNRDREQSIQEATDTYEKFYGNKKYYKTTKRSVEYVKNWIKKETKDKIFLDYACGNGFNAILAAKNGAKLAIGIDLSPVSIKNSIHDAGDLLNIVFFQDDCEATSLPDNSIDTIICSGMLHHLDLSYSFYELRRILKPGGKVLCVEALDYNPMIKIYRAFTPSMRTEWEKAHILDYSDLKFARRFFKVQNILHWHILGYVGAKIPFLAKLLDGLDILFEKTPLVRSMAWLFTFELVKD